MHGTCACSLEKIKASGLRPNTYLTNDLDIALYYAGCASDVCQSGCNSQMVIDVEVDIKDLKADFNSYNEPLTLFRNEHTESDRDWHEMVESGEIPSPKNKDDHQTSLDVVKSALHPLAISKSQLIF